ncbi:MAG: DUF1566 domain-containing protein, partial [Thiotrichaceae bacterium]|nr:DUF1566 domain-containing protein [Thiotrichaceae bacterium]
DRSFTLDETNETIIDNDLGLTWQNIANIDQNWSDAIATCNDLELKGKTDWRLPNIHELVSIANKTKTDPASYQEFNQSIHPRYWSSTSYINDDSRAWIIHLTSSSEGTVSETKSNNNIYARCVRGKSQTERTFIRDFATKIVYDTNSDLLWHDAEKTQESDNLTWQQANTYCADMIVGGYTWRVPSFSELQSIVNYDSFLPSINKEVFLNINSEGHWASTVDANAVSNKAWSIRFSGGEGVLEDKDSPSRTQSAKCVTDAQ